MHANNIRSQKVDRLAQHRGLGLDSSNAPGHDAKSIYHCGVGVGAHQRVRVVNTIPLPDAFAKVFKIHLVTNPDSRRNDAETVKGLSPPLEKLVARIVSLEFHDHIFLECIRRAREVDLYGVIDYEING